MTNFDRLREGKTVEIEPGRTARLNLKDKTFEDSKGKRIYVGGDEDFFPKDESALIKSREKEKIQGEIYRRPAGEFLYQFGQSGLAGASKDWYNKLTQKGDEYTQKKLAQAEVSADIAEESPVTSGAATLASFAPDIALTGGMSAARAAPTLAALHAGPRIIEEPEQVAKEAAIGAAGGYLIDKASSFLNKAAQRRKAIQEFPGKQASVQQQNIAEKNAVDAFNAGENAKFQALRQNVKGANESALKQHQADIETIKNKIIADKNAYENEKFLRESNILKLKNDANVAKANNDAIAKQLESEYLTAKRAAESEERRLAQQFKLQQEQYQEALKKMPELQKKAQLEHGENVVRNMKELEKSFPKNSLISSEELGVSEYIDNQINKSGLAGSAEGSKASRILKSIFPESEIVGGRELSKRYKALEDAIQRSSPEIQEVLSGFKKEMGKRLPEIMENSITFSKIMPSLKKTAETDLKSVLSKVPNLDKATISASNASLSSALREFTPAEFARRLKSGQLGRDLAEKVLKLENFIPGLDASSIQRMMSHKGEWASTNKFLLDQARQKQAFAITNLAEKLDNRLAQYELKAAASSQDVSKKFAKDLRATYGLSKPVEPPSSPSAPPPVDYPIPPSPIPAPAPIQVPPPISPPTIPNMPPKPSMIPEPIAPTAKQFTPIPEPVLSPASGLGERAGDFMEKNLLGGNTLANNPLTKLAGLKYILGKGAIPAEAAYLGLKGLSSPTVAGEVARSTFKQGGIQAIDSWARKYPSYRNGVLESPQERRSLTKEVEDDFEIPIEQKAIIQSKINRGKPLQSAL